MRNTTEKYLGIIYLLEVENDRFVFTDQERSEWDRVEREEKDVPILI